MLLLPSAADCAACCCGLSLQPAAAAAARGRLDGIGEAPVRGADAGDGPVAGVARAAAGAADAFGDGRPPRATANPAPAVPVQASRGRNNNLPQLEYLQESAQCAAPIITDDKCSLEYQTAEKARALNHNTSNKGSQGCAYIKDHTQEVSGEIPR